MQTHAKDAKQGNTKKRTPKQTNAIGRSKQSTCVYYQKDNLPLRKDEFLDKNGVLEQCDCIWSHPNAVR